MKSYSLTVFKAAELIAFRRASYIVRDIPDSVTRCHEVARIVHRRFEDIGRHDPNVRGYVVVDGTYGACEHSWLVSPWKNVLDTYAVGRLPQVQLVNLFAGTPADAMYRPGPDRTDIDEALIRKVIEGWFE